jgi:hypothetical protein
MVSTNGISAEIQTPNHWDLIVRSMADSLSSAAAPSSILPPLFKHCI